MVVFDAYLSKLKLSIYLNVFNAPYVLKICKCVKNYTFIYFMLLIFKYAALLIEAFIHSSLLECVFVLHLIILCVLKDTGRDRNGSV